MKRGKGFLRLKLTVGVILSVLSTAGMAHAWTLTGSPITNETGKTGRMFFSVVDQYGNQVAGAVAPSGSATGIIRGVPTGNFTVKAFIDTQGTGFQHANDPVFSSGTMNVSADSGGPVTFDNPTPVAAVAPGMPMVMPLNAAAVIFIDTPTTDNNIPIADKYDIYWSTSNTPGPGNTVGGGQLQVKNGKAPQLIYNLTNGVQYYFSVNAVVNGGSSALSAVSDPVTPSNTPAAGGSTVNVTVDTTEIAKSSTPLVVVLSDDNNKAYFSYVRTSSDLQTVAIPGVESGTYKIYAFLDLAGNGIFNALANPSNSTEIDRNQRPVPIMVDGVTPVVTGPKVKLAVKKSGVSVGTSHSNYGGIESYGLSFKVVQMNRQLASVTLEGGPQVSGPIDMGTATDNDNIGEFELQLPVNSRPAVGDTYSFTLTYADGAQETEIRTAAVTAVLDNFPGGVFPSGSIGPGNVSLLAWNNPGNLPGFLTTGIGMNGFYAEFLPMSALSAPYEGSSFAAGQSYSWYRSVRDLDGNQTQSSIGFTPSASGPTITDFNPKSGPAGTSVTISGSGFSGTPGNNLVQFNGMAATVTVASPTSLTVTAPASSGVITVMVNGVAAGSSVPFAATTTFNLTVTDGSNGTTPLVGATVSLVENPTVSATTGADGTAILPVPARPYFSLAFNQSGYYPTYSPLMSLTQSTTSGFSLFSPANLATRGTPLSPGKGLIYSTVQDLTTNAATPPKIGGAVVTATSLLHPDTPYTVRYTNNTPVVDPAATVTAGDGRYYVLDVDEGDYVTVTASKGGMGFQSRLFITHAGAVNQGSIKGAIVLASQPTASPAGGAYSATQNVTLNNPDSTNYDIYYTTNGSDPALFGMKYNTGATIPISLNTTLKFVTKNKWVGQAVGSVQTATYTIGGGISGIVTASGTGSGIPNINAQLYDWNGMFVSGLNTDGSGNYSFGGLPVGTYKVCFYPGGTSYVGQCYNNQSLAPSSATPVQVTLLTPQVTGINASLALGTSISGTVTASGTGNGIQNINVQLYDQNGNVFIQGVNTNGAGNYTINGVALGTYKVCFNPNGNNYIGQCYNNQSQNPQNATPIPVSTLASPVTGINAVMSQGGSITGRVTNSSNVGMGGVWVNVYDANGFYLGIPGATTQPDGTYTLGGVPAGSYKVYFDGSGAGYISQWYSNKTTSMSADSVTVNNGVPTSGINSVMSQGGSITGRVTNSSNVGIGGVFVNVNDANGNYLGINSAMTQADGTYTLGGIPAGSYKINFIGGGAGYISQWYSNKTTSTSADPVTVNLGATTTNINAVLAQGGSISGRVTNSSNTGIGGVFVNVNDANGNNMGLAGANTQQDGSYTIGGLPAGSYKLYFYGGGSGYISQWYSNKTTSTSADPVTVNLGTTTSGINAVLAQGGSISGRVTNSSNVGIGGVWVNLNDANGNNLGIPGATTQQDGNYTIGGVPAGSYKVSFDGSQSGYGRRWYNNALGYDTATPVTVTPPGSVTGINATLPQVGAISGRVTSAGSGLAGVMISVNDAATDTWVNGANTDNAGNYTISGVPTGSYKVQFMKTGYVTQWYNNKLDIGTANSVQVTAPGTTNLTDVVINLYAPSLTVDIGVGGSINNLAQPPSFSCSSPNTSCNNTFPVGTSFTLHASPSSNYTFAGWSGGCSSINGSGDCVISSLNFDTWVTATFTAASAAKMNGIGYATLLDAYSWANNADTIQARDTEFIENLTLNKNIAVTLKGGYNSDFTANTGVTTLHGILTIGTGALTIEKIAIR